MAKTARKMATAMVAAGAILAGPLVSAAADSASPEVASPASIGHVRSANPAIAALIQQASERSTTFRGLVETIDASDSFVFVNEGKCGHGVRACFVSVRSTNTNRFMFVLVDTRKADWDLMGSIGHELRHTIEVIGAPGVRSDAAKYFFYEGNGKRSIGGTSETVAAMDAGNTVRSEVQKFNRQARSR